MTFVWATLFPAGSLGRCRFSPTCSDYARQAIKQYGMILGVWLSIKRLLRCHPGNLGGYDPVK
ncbi:membrane protein insertion efficiency factor YidD [Candidatus Beckwithbacteria bacterium RBG_13_42_9]|uniref:Membrane protein insertion efficiency factor YidD n=1 Tax=Candidatus Beckwithbacteria bacterium RBG_13_42_9 TaxID=1797457 RepID=A0A1F5E5X6_9BACT|nr:MAG: membrane protein insertion efficiency factor YidD [Candidatus Beckwithbacteria bacterium RBG_13_42_9]